MSQSSNRTDLFNRWASYYDQALQTSSEGFPFDGYNRVLSEVVQQSSAVSGLSVLDVGTGTGNLVAPFVDLSCMVWGVDFSGDMLAKARQKLPQAQFAHMNLQQVDWSAELPHHFDRIVSAYVLHEFETVHKIHLIQLWMEHLTDGGCVVIGDIAFPDTQAFDIAHRQWADRWDEDEHYWIAEQAVQALVDVGLTAEYTPVSSCGGVFLIRR